MKPSNLSKLDTYLTYMSLLTPYGGGDRKHRNGRKIFKLFSVHKVKQYIPTNSIPLKKQQAKI